MLNEFNIIASLKKSFPGYIGDDAAIIEMNDCLSYVITKDLMIEDIHFRRHYFDPASLAHKALQVNLSDLAAMGGEPKFIVCGIAIPLNDEDYSQSFLTHFSNCCKNANVILIGGDTTKSPDKLFISITAIGLISTKNIKYRSTAQRDDLICIAGNLGNAHLGFLACEQGVTGFQHYQDAFLRPDAKVFEGQWLSTQKSVHSMMDISDGVCIDLKRLCEASKLKGHIQLETLEVSNHFRFHSRLLKLNPIEVLLTGGEDYSLLFTVDKNNMDTLSFQFRKQFRYNIKCIGYLSEGSGVCFEEYGLNTTLRLKPFSHFGENI